MPNVLFLKFQLNMRNKERGLEVGFQYSIDNPLPPDIFRLVSKNEANF